MNRKMVERRGEEEGACCETRQRARVDFGQCAAFELWWLSVIGHFVVCVC